MKEKVLHMGNEIIMSDEKLTLFHGSKAGIMGNIKPLSRENCDFGRGFYMGIESEENRSKGIALADEICRRYRREGRFFDEILEAGQ